MATIHLSRSLARYADGASTLRFDAARVDELMRTIVDTYPDLAGPLEIMAIEVDGEIHQHPDYLTLASDSEVHFVPRIAGG